MHKLHAITIVAFVFGCDLEQPDGADARDRVTAGEASGEDECEDCGTGGTEEGGSTSGDDGGATSGGDEGENGSDDGCTLTQGYWKNHPDDWTLPRDSSLCDQTYPDILATAPKGDAWYILGHQWIAASLNVAGGAVPGADVADALAQGEVLLEACSIADADRATAIELSTLLDRFNNGNIGPGHCHKDEGGGDEGGGDEGGGDEGGGDEGGGDDGDDCDCSEDTDGGRDDGSDGSDGDDGSDGGSVPVL